MRTLQTEYDQSPSVMTILQTSGKRETIVQLLNANAIFSRWLLVKLYPILIFVFVFSVLLHCSSKNSRLVPSLSSIFSPSFAFHSFEIFLLLLVAYSQLRSQALQQFSRQISHISPFLLEQIYPATFFSLLVRYEYSHTNLFFVRNARSKTTTDFRRETLSH